jgi:O-antigen/teichoic acid export membrane protein
MRARRYIPSWTRQWAGDSGIALLAQVQVTVVTTALAIILARSLGPSDWGLFSTFLGLAFAAGLIINFGFASWLLREFSAAWSEDAETAPRIAGDLLVHLLVLTAILGTASVVLSAVAVLLVGLSFDLALTLAALVAHTALGAVAYGFEAALRAQRRIRVVLIATLLEKTVLIALAAGAVVADLGLLALGAAYVLSGVARAVFTYIPTLHRFPFPDRWPGPVAALRQIRHSAPFAFTFASLNLVPRLDLVFIAAFSTVSASYYAIGDRIVNAAAILPTVASMTLFPFLSRDSESRSGAGAVGLLTAFGCLAGVGGALLAPTVIPFVFGEEYSGGVEVTQVMVLSLPFIFGSNALLAVLNVGRQERRLAKRTLPATVVGSAGVLVGQVLFGVVGAAVAFTLRQVLFFGVLVFLALRPPAPHPPLAADRPVLEKAGRA